MTSTAIERSAKDNPLSGSEMTFLVVAGVAAVGLVGGALYMATKRSPSAPGGSSATGPEAVAANPSQQITSGNWILIGAIAGADPATGAALPGMNVMTAAQIETFFSNYGWSSPHLLWYGPTQNTNDPENYLLIPRIGTGKFRGVYILTASYSGPSYPLPAQGVVAYKIG